MSVPASQRKTSSMEYIKNATQLAARVARFTHAIPKRYTFQIGNPLYQHAFDVVYNCKAANSVYVNSQATFDQRREYLNAAVTHLDHIETMLDICLELAAQNNTNKKLGNINTYEEIISLIDQEKKLISGCKRHDTQAFKQK